MYTWHLAANAVASALSLAVLAGLVARGRARRSYAFAAYTVVIAAQGARQFAAGEPYSWSTWLVVELLLRLLCMVVALEIGVRLFGSLTEAARRARRAIVAVLASTVVFLVIDLPTPEHPHFIASTPGEVVAFETAQRLLPRLAYGSAWLFAALFAVATAYALPLDPLHRFVMMGFGAYLWLYAITLATLQAIELHATIVSAVHTVAFLGLLMLWNYGAWRREGAPDIPSVVLRRLWPWS